MIAFFIAAFLLLCLATILPLWLDGILIFVLIVFVILALVASAKEKAKSDEEKEVTKLYSGKSLQTIGKVVHGDEVNLKLDSKANCLRILKGSIDIKIPYERLKGFWVENETTLAKSHDGLGEALIGGMLFGTAGTVAGAMSGKGNTERRWFATVAYEDKQGASQELHFMEMGLANEYKGANKSDNALFFEKRIKDIVAQHQPTVSEL